MRLPWLVLSQVKEQFLTLWDQIGLNHVSVALIAIHLHPKHLYSKEKKGQLQHIGRKWCSIPLDFRAELILKSAEMTEIGKTLVSPSQLICMDSKTRDILSISVISADLRIKSARKSSGMEHHLRPLCCRNFQALVSVRFGLVRFGYCHFGSINRSGPNRYRTKASFKILTKQFSS